MLLPLHTCETYQKFVLSYLKSLSKSGRGHSSKIAMSLGIHSTLFSQIVRGHRNFTPEQAALFCDVVGLSDQETELFLRMVDLERAGNESLKKKLQARLESLRSEFRNVKSRVRQSSKTLTEAERAIFYSHWHYSGIRMLCSTDMNWTLDMLATALKSTNKRIRDMTAFLCRTGLLIEEQDRFSVGEATTHVEAHSEWAYRHHANWRTKHLNQLENVSEKELCFTAPFTCSEEDARKIREILMTTIETVAKVVKSSDSKKAFAVCIDFLNIL